ncbi:MAG TPA: zinc-binding dehydrogenase, partial [Acidimicrobiales bacterium]
MEAVIIRDAELHIETRDDPAPGSTELLVAVHAAGINAADLVQRAGFYPAPPGSPPDIPGMELAGEVVAIGRQVTRFAVGDRVMGVVGGGAQATLAVIDEAHALAAPASMPWPEAGGFAEAFSTAFDAIFTRGELTMGDRVLISGAAGGVGTAAVQLASAAGATVVATVRDQARHADVADLGATIVIEPDAVAEHGPYDVVLELVGAPSLKSVLPHMATEGRVVVIGVGAGSKLDLDLFRLMMPRIRIGGATLRARTRTEKANVARAVTRHVLPLLEAGRLRVPVCDSFPLAEAATAYE